MEVLPWCVQSPDLNPIEHMWKALKLRINKRPRLPHSEQELIGAIVEEWENISVELSCILVDRMPRRVQEVVNRKGASTHY